VTTQRSRGEKLLKNLGLGEMGRGSQSGPVIVMCLIHKRLAQKGPREKGGEKKCHQEGPDALEKPTERL